MGIAAVVDPPVLRMLLLPAPMWLLGRCNWGAPARSLAGACGSLGRSSIRSPRPSVDGPEPGSLEPQALRRRVVLRRLRGRDRTASIEVATTDVSHLG